MKKYVKWIVAAVMLITFMVMYLAEYSHVIIFHEQHHLFQFSGEYWSAMSHQKGFWWPLMEFMVQFGYYPWLGALVWTLALVGTYLMLQSIIYRLTGLRDLIQLSCILPCWMFFKTVDVDVQPIDPTKWFFIVLIAWVVALILGRFIPKMCKPDSGQVRGSYRWILPAGGVLLFLIVFYLFHSDFYGPRTIEINGRKQDIDREKVMEMRHNEKLMIMADQAVRRGDWDEVLELANQVLRSGNNHLMAYFRSLALYHRGELTTQLFDLPQKFSELSLFFPWTADRNKAEYGGIVYEQMGALNTATHWEFEAMVGWGETAGHLINLSKYYIESGKPKQAKKFIAPLKRTLFYRGKARELEEWMAKGDVPDLRDALKNVPDSVHQWDNVLFIGEDAKFVLTADPENRMAKEYLMMSLLLRNNVGLFYHFLKQYYPAGTPLPRCFYEAMCLMRIEIGAEGLAADGYEIPASVEKDFNDYVAEKQKGANARFSPAQKRTYWYYATMVSRYAPTIDINTHEQEFETTPQINNTAS